ncbi:MAG TPA: hypothetical protein DCE78_08320 [Bacteroidetes bacterium]|nr:hypothetical protein [Bacteroidota bacterium]
MKKSSPIRVLLSLFLAFTILSCNNPKPMTYQVYILSGQSNMDGLGLVAELPGEYLVTQNDVPIYNPNRKNDQEQLEDLGFWESLNPGHGSGYSTDGTQSFFSDKFGVELSFAKKMQELNPNANIALYKYAKGGASIHPDAAGDWGSFHPDYEVGNGLNQWDHFEYHYRRAMKIKDVNGDGVDDVLVPAGLLWLQGESDASYTQEIAETYEQNLKYLIQRVRELTGNPALPVVIARISESNLSENSPDGVVLRYGEIVIAAQEKIANDDPNVSIIYPPDTIGWLDPWHYDTQTYLDLGISFAESMTKLNQLSE